MINEVIVEGIVVREPWKFMEDLFFRLVVYRDTDQPSKKLDQERDAGDYINIRVNGGANGLILRQHEIVPRVARGGKRIEIDALPQYAREGNLAAGVE